MLFNSFSFLIFFPIVTILYFLLPHKFRWFHLLMASCLFYMFFIPVYIFILVVTILIDYWAAFFIVKSEGKQKKKYLIISIISTCMVLFVFKYFNFFNTNFEAIAQFFGLHYPVRAINIILPIGLSFHTFQSLSYVIEVYRGNQKLERNFGIYALYVMFYPQLVAGPIERPNNLLHQFREVHFFENERVVEGLKMMLWGLFKKVVVADRLSVYVNAVYNNAENHSSFSLLLATIFFAFQIYCDFSGYSDIAIGSAKVMGFKLMTNFRRPYLSKSIAEFWQRWHISLSTWFRDYVYIPLGGNRVPEMRRFYNILITFTISGLWHGANWTYVIWGALNGTYMILAILRDKLLNKIKLLKLKLGNSSLNIFLTFVITCFAWIFFRAKSFDQAVLIIQRILQFKGPLFISTPALMIYGICGILIVLLNDIIVEYDIKKLRLFQSPYTIVRRTAYVGAVLLILLVGVFDGSQFIYFQF